MIYDKSQFQNWLESVAVENQEIAAEAWQRYLRGRESNPPALDLGRRQAEATAWAKDARRALWDCLGYERRTAP